MADNRKYYYLKLKENFFDSDSIVLLEDMKDGRWTCPNNRPTYPTQELSAG